MSEAKAEQRSLVKKLAEIMGEVERVPKSGRNNFHNYDYATEADISGAVRAGMAKRSVMLIPSVEKTEWGEVPTKSGTPEKLCTLTVRFTLEDGDSGETRSYVVIGQGSDRGDKASYKAMTGAEKYALLKLFLIPTGDDPERDEKAAAPRPAAKPMTTKEAIQAPKYKGRPISQMEDLEVKDAARALQAWVNAPENQKARARQGGLDTLTQLRMEMTKRGLSDSAPAATAGVQ